eukprot:scaffold26594_cov160-Skeletonema_menzelii.AAC.1
MKKVRRLQERRQSPDDVIVAGDRHQKTSKAAIARLWGTAGRPVLFKSALRNLPVFILLVGVFLAVFDPGSTTHFCD